MKQCRRGVLVMLSLICNNDHHFARANYTEQWVAVESTEKLNEFRLSRIFLSTFVTLLSCMGAAICALRRRETFVSHFFLSYLLACLCLLCWELESMRRMKCNYAKALRSWRYFYFVCSKTRRRRRGGWKNWKVFVSWQTSAGKEDETKTRKTKSFKTITTRK